jgi:hypothetical protein
MLRSLQPKSSGNICTPEISGSSRFYSIRSPSSQITRRSVCMSEIRMMARSDVPSRLLRPEYWPDLMFLLDCLGPSTGQVPAGAS